MNVKELHRQAMAHADDGDFARRSGDSDLAKACFSEAMALEREAAELCESQPSRSILLRSAAWLALSAGDSKEAKRLAEKGLSDPDVPERMRSELRDVLEKAGQQISGQDRRDLV